MAYKRRIKLIVTTEDSTSTSEVKAPNVTQTMLDAANDFIYTLMTGERRPAVVTGETITDAQIKWLFKQYCKCRSMDIERTSHSHDDCVRSLADVCREALTVRRDRGVSQRKARERCAECFNAEIGLIPGLAPMGPNVQRVM